MTRWLVPIVLALATLPSPASERALGGRGLPVPDGELRVPFCRDSARSCANATDCCPERACLAGRCCSGTYQACSTDGDCCNGVCRDGRCCLPDGAFSGEGCTGCCTPYCPGGYCASCLPAGSTSSNCNQGTACCPPSVCFDSQQCCLPLGETCSAGFQCCGAPSVTACCAGRCGKVPGQFCSSSAECCSNYCLGYVCY